MRIRKEIKAVSTLAFILLILVSAVIGALLAYMWAIAPFYLEPENTVDLIVTDAVFPVKQSTYFNVTVMNPSHSIGKTNITNIYLTGEDGLNRTAVTTTDPSLPVSIDKGTSRTINCAAGWGGLAGKKIIVHLATENSTEIARIVTTDLVRLIIDADFNSTESIRFFNVTLRSDENSAINLTLNSVSLDFNPLANQNLSIALPRVIQKNETIEFGCLANWEGHVKPVVTVGTAEGYTAEIRRDVNASVGLQITNIAFNETDSSRLGITLSNSADSGTLVTVTRIDLTYGNVTNSINGNLSNPPLPFGLDVNSSVTLDCLWNWTDINQRDVNLAVTAYTKQGFESPAFARKTPSQVAGKIGAVGFDLADTGHFTVNVTNLPYSTQVINITNVYFNQNVTSMSPTLISAGEQASLTCAFNWSAFVGKSATVTAQISFGTNGSSIVYSTTLPYFEILNVSFYDLSLQNPYANVTLRNSEFSGTNATLTSIVASTQNGTIVSLNGTLVTIPAGQQSSIILAGNWKQYLHQDITVTVQMLDGFQASITLKVE